MSNKINFKDRSGEIHTLKNGHTIKITVYRGANSWDVLFEDGTIKENVRYYQIKTGYIRKPEKKEGLVFTTNQGYSAEIIQYIRNTNSTVLIDGKHAIKGVSFRALKDGFVKNRHHKAVFGVGFIGVGKYSARGYKQIYERWYRMIKKCYSKTSKFSTCKEWHNFQNFAKWHEKNYNPETMKNWYLCVKHKKYSSENCLFKTKKNE